jgi:magnesium transporter
VIVDCALYRDGKRTETEGDCRTLRDAAERDGGFVWVGLHEPGPEEIQDVAETFGLHPLAVEDAVKAHQRPKLERYGDSLFLILKTLWYVDEDDAVETGEIAMFVAREFVVTAAARS